MTRSFAADLARLRSLQVGDPEHWLSEFDAERIFQDWARETWGQENPYCATYQSGGFPCWDVFDKVCVYVCVCVCVCVCGLKSCPGCWRILPPCARQVQHTLPHARL